MNTRAYLLYAECVKMGHGKFAGQIYKKYKDEFPGYKDSMDIFGFYAWHDPAADILEGVRYVREQMIQDGSYQPKEVRALLMESEEAAKGYALRNHTQDVAKYRKWLNEPSKPFFKPVYDTSKSSIFRQILLFFTRIFKGK